MSDSDQHPTEWIEISVDIQSEYAEPVTHLFSKYGDGMVFVQQSGDWDIDDPEDSNEDHEVTVCGYLIRDHSIDERKTMIDIGLKLMGELTSVKRKTDRIVTAAEWGNQSFPSVRVGKHIFISPVGEKSDPTPQNLNSDSQDVHINLIPGLAFGTGNHPTTRMCLQEIEREFERGNLESKTVLDVGCGSGVLSIAALKMRAAHALCLDIDEIAIRAVQQNLRLSGVADKSSVIQGSLPNDDLSVTQFDIVLANITTRVISDIADHLIDATKVGGSMIISGILTEKSKDLRMLFASRNVELDSERIDGDWLMWHYSKTD